MLSFDLLKYLEFYLPFLNNKFNLSQITHQIQSTNSLRPIIMDNASPLRITAAAGTKVGQGFFFDLKSLS